MDLKYFFYVALFFMLLFILFISSFIISYLEWQLEAVTHERDHAKRGWSRARRQLRLLESLQKLGPFQQAEERDGEDEVFNSV